MKYLKLIVVGIVLFFASTMQAQISVNVHLGTPPQWGPQGYSDARYYYLPDVEAYYDVRASRFIYYDGRVWVHRTYLPSRYRNYDLYNGYKVVMSDYRGNRPYTNFRDHRRHYARGYRGHAQRSIGQRPGRGHSYGNRHSNNRSYKNNNQGRGHNVQQSHGRNQGRSYNKPHENKHSRSEGRGNDRGEGHGNQSHGNSGGQGRR